MKASNTTIRLFTEVGLLMKSRIQSAVRLPFGQCQALWFVSQSDRPSMQEVARYFKITAPSATFLIDELVRGGYLGRRASAGDRRKVELALTAKGKQAVKTFTEKRTQVLNVLFKTLSKSDRAELDRILGKILAN